MASGGVFGVLPFWNADPNLFSVTDGQALLPSESSAVQLLVKSADAF